MKLPEDLQVQGEGQSVETPQRRVHAFPEVQKPEVQLAVHGPPTSL